jgi:NAD/NADP transhydrogenase alpha subunit
VPKESHEGERRVALTPSSAAALLKAGFKVGHAVRLPPLTACDHATLFTQSMVADIASGVCSVCRQNVVVEAGAGAGARFSDEEYTKAGAKVVDRAQALKSDIVVKVGTAGVKCLRSAFDIVKVILHIQDPLLLSQCWPPRLL